LPLWDYNVNYVHQDKDSRKTKEEKLRGWEYVEELSHDLLTWGLGYMEGSPGKVGGKQGGEETAEEPFSPSDSDRKVLGRSRIGNRKKKTLIAPLL